MTDVRQALLEGAEPNAALDGRVKTGGELDLVLAYEQFTGGSIRLDRRAYRSDAVAEVTIRDSQAPATNATVSVDWRVISNGTRGVRASGVLTNHRVGATAFFTNVLELVSGVTAVHGDELVFEYMNAAGASASASVPIDDVPPVITDGEVVDVSDDGAIFRWVTDEPAGSAVLIKQSLPLDSGATTQRTPGYRETPVVDGGVTQYIHTLTATGLSLRTLHFVALSSDDFAGNTTTAPTNLSSTAAAEYFPVITRHKRAVATEDFESGPGAWTTVSVSNVVWELGQPTYGPDGAASGTNCWGTVLDGRYPPLENAWVESPSYAVQENPELTFRLWYDIVASIQGYRDALFIEMFDGTGWQNITDRGNIAVGDAVNGASDGWIDAEFLLPEYDQSTLKFRWRLETDGNTQAAGVYLDDMALHHYGPVGIEVVGATVDDDPALSPANDGDGYAEPGESFYLQMQVFNSDPDRTYSNVAGFAQSLAADVPLAGGSASMDYGDIAPGQVSLSTTQILLTASASATEARVIHTLTSDATGPDAETFVIPIEVRESLTGRVTDVTGGAGIAGATVHAEAPGSETVETTTAADGSYALHGLAPSASYAVQASLPGTYSPSAAATAAAPAALDFELGRAYGTPQPSLLTITLSQDEASAQTVILSNALGDVEYWYDASVAYSNGSDWIELETERGRVEAGSDSNFTFTVDAKNLAISTYEARILLAGNSVHGDPQAIDVRVEVVESPLLRLLRVDLDGGDGDAFAEPGEALSIHPVLYNAGNAPATQLGGTLAGAGGNWSLSDTTGQWPVIGPFSIENATNEFGADVSAGAADGDVLTADLTVTNFEGQVWTFPLAVTVTVRHALSGRISLCADAATGVADVEVRATSADHAVSASTDTNGLYVLTGLRDGATYTIRPLPSAPYASPGAQQWTVNGDVANVDFCLAVWGMALDPTALDVEIDEGREFKTNVLVRNLGTTEGSVELTPHLVSGLSDGPIHGGSNVFPAVAWTGLKAGEDYMPGELIVRYADDATDAEASAAAARAGATVRAALPLLNAWVVRTAANMDLQTTAELLEREPDVLYAEPNYIARPLEMPDDLYFPDQYALRNLGQTDGTVGADIGVTGAWSRTVGSRDVLLGIVDTGVERNHPDLAGNLWVNEGEDWVGGVPGNNGIDDDGNGYVDDYYGWDSAYGDNEPRPDWSDVISAEEHGTHVAGIAGATGDNGIGVSGVSQAVGLLAVKASRSNIDISPRPFFTIDAQVGALAYMLSNGVHISNHSYGGSRFSRAMWEAIGVAYSNGHLMVCAAGNDGLSNDLYPQYPASYNWPNILSVAATDHDDILAPFSNYGTETVDLAAPGVDILSTVSDGEDLHTYEPMSGTSMAAPTAAGAAALLFSAAPGASWEIVKQALLDGARPNPMLEPLIAEGRQLDVNGALAWLASFWLQIAPTAGNIPAGGSLAVTNVLNAGGRLQAGEYEADVVVSQGRLSTNLPVRLRVLPAPVPSVAGIEIDDAVWGDGDGLAEPGETVRLIVSLENQGSAILTSPQGVLSSSAAGVSLHDDTLAWPSLASSDTVGPTNTAEVSFTAAAPGLIPMTLTVTDGVREPWVLSFSLLVAERRSIRGQVYGENSGDGVAGAVVELWGDDGAATATDSNGWYRFDGLTNVPANYVLRAVSSNHAESAAIPLAFPAGGLQTVHIPVGAPRASLSTNRLDSAVQAGLRTTASFAVRNDGADEFQFDAVEMPHTRAALIADGEQFAGLEDLFFRLGFDTDLYTNNFAYRRTFGGTIPTVRYTADDAVVSGYDLVVLDASGDHNQGRLLLSDERDVLQQYLARGGTLMLTGMNPLTRPDDEHMTALFAASNATRAASSASRAVLESALPSALFGLFETGSVVRTRAFAPESADLGAGVTGSVYAAVGGLPKIRAFDLDTGGSVWLWAGNENGSEWRANGVWQDVLKNLLVGTFAQDVPWLDVTHLNGTVSSGVLTNELLLDADDLPPGEHRAAVLIRGHYSGRDEDAVHIALSVEAPTLKALSSAGVVNWRNQPLAGDGSEESAIVQLLWAGLDGAIDPPAADGGAGGDDQVLFTRPGGSVLTRIGAGEEFRPDLGRFEQLFSHDIRPSDLSRAVYARAWDAASFDEAVAYGDSSLYEIRNEVGEEHDFGRWVVDRAPGYPAPGGGAPDRNGDSIPDGWTILTGGDPRRPLGPAPSSATFQELYGNFGTADDQLYQPYKLFCAGDLVFVLDTRNNAVKVWDDADDEWIGVLRNEFGRPEGMGLDPRAGQSRFAVADTQNSRIQVFAYDPATGAATHERTFGSLGTADGRFNRPAGVAVGPLGRLYVADTGNDRIQVFGEDGAHLHTFGTRGGGIGQFLEPAGIALDEAGLVYVADTGNDRIQVFSGSGSPIGSFGSSGTGEGRFDGPRDVRIDGLGRILVADTSNHRIQVFDDSYGFLLAFGGGGSDAGELRFPSGVWPCDARNTVLVADTYNNRIQVFRTTIDADGDGMDDRWEANNGLDPTVDDSQDDPDGDGVVNIGEERLNTDPRNADTDGDGVADGAEIARGRDPLTANFDEVLFTLIRNDAGLHLRFTARAGLAHQLQAADDLGPGAAWTNLAGYSLWPATNGPAAFSVNGGAASNRWQFFRILRHAP
jgi:subtilisin family serine protease